MSDSSSTIFYLTILSILCGGILLLSMLGLYVYLTAREVVKNRDDWAPRPPSHQYFRQSSSDDGDSDVEKNTEKETDIRFSIYDDYETIPEEYWESKETKNYPKLPSIAEYDLANDNDQITK